MSNHKIGPQGAKIGVLSAPAMANYIQKAQAVWPKGQLALDIKGEQEHSAKEGLNK
jgi:hypothetical protein